MGRDDDIRCRRKGFLAFAGPLDGHFSFYTALRIVGCVEILIGDEIVWVEGGSLVCDC